MERTLSPEEKIRRAEEIYSRRRNQYVKSTVATVNISKDKNYGLFKKMILQISICLVIYFIFYLVQSGNYIFSQDVIGRAKEILSYDINIPNMYNQAAEYIHNQVQNFQNHPNDTNTENTINNENSQSNTMENSEVEGNVIEENAIGGANLEDAIMEETPIVNEEKEKIEEAKIETDDDYIRNNFSFIKPVNRYNIFRVWTKRYRESNS